MNANDRIYVAGHDGMVGSAVCRALTRRGFKNLITASYKSVNLIDQAATHAFIAKEKPTVMLVAAAKVGGIGANSAANGAFLYENMQIAANTIHAAYQNGVKRLLFLGSSCIYPRLAPQPIPENALLTGSLEATNEGYALAKIAGLKLCEFYRRDHGVCYHSLMPTNLYGTGDNYHLQGSHVLPAMIRKFETARTTGAESVPLWGSGNPLREFLHVDDLAEACCFMLDLENPPDWVNVGSGREIAIRDLALLIKNATGCPADPVFDPAMPDGTPRKLIDTTLIRSLGWMPRIDLEEGIARTVGEFRKGLADGTLRM